MLQLGSLHLQFLAMVGHRELLHLLHQLLLPAQEVAGQQVLQLVLLSLQLHNVGGWSVVGNVTAGSIMKAETLSTT